MKRSPIRPSAERLRRVRQASEALIAALEPEDLCLQGMPDASPPKWHLAHTTWFFETFLLAGSLGERLGHQPADPAWGFLFNSYYDSVGARHPRPQRGLLTRPPLAAVLAWRHRVDRSLERLLDLLCSPPPDLSPAAVSALQDLLELGLQHEQQHQELLLMDLLDGFSRHPLEPAYEAAVQGWEASFRAAALVPTSTVSSSQDSPSPEPGSGGESAPPLSATGILPSGSPLASASVRPREQDGSPWLELAGGLVQIGHHGRGFHFDNEAPRHRVWLEPFSLSSQLVSNADYAAFIAAGGYERPELWLSEGWAVRQQRGWQAPRYWRDGEEFTLAGRQPRLAAAPVRHLSWFEADAFARWAGARLPSEAEWELACASLALPQAFGLVWQWTCSPYRPYPGFQPAPGAVGEYNGKFMSSQIVLRGSGYLTPADHARPTYRNFFPPASRWMAAGLRLARGGEPQ
ncbi:MAG: ergothioneine biosynthesis protein EgtB [Synechococcaceae cyanobacterium]|nr:ergothioneine biosynthesis protein EgtB [Synechococcaceae cyanobacterium]